MNIGGNVSRQGHDIGLQLTEHGLLTMPRLDVRKGQEVQVSGLPPDPGFEDQPIRFVLVNNNAKGTAALRRYSAEAFQESVPGLEGTGGGP